MKNIELFKIFGSIVINNSEANQSLADTDSKAAGVSERFGKGVGVVAAWGSALVSAAAVAVGAIAKVGIGYNMMQENSQVAWETLLGTQEEAKKMLEDIGNFAKNTQFETAQVDQMAKYLHNAGLEGQGLFDELTKVADVAGAFNIPAESANELVRQMSQVRQAGVAYTEDLNILQDRGVPIYKAISEQLGVTVGDVKKMASEGKISSEIYLAAFDSIAQGVAGSSEKQSQTMSGMLSTLKDNLTQIAGTLTEGLFGKLKGVLDSVMPMIEKFSTTLKDEGLKAAILSLIPEEFLQKISALKEQFAPFIDSFKTSFQTLKDSAGPIMESLKQLFESLKPILEAVGIALGAFLVIAVSVFNGAMQAVGPLIDAIINFADVVVNVLMAVIAFLSGDFDGAMKAWNKATESAIEVFKSLWEAVKGFFGGIIDTIVGLLAGFGVDVETKFQEMKTKAINKVQELKEQASTKFQEIKDSILNPIEEAKNNLSTKFGEIKTAASTKFREIKDAIMNPIKEAKEKVGGFVDDIKGFFSNLRLKLPDIKTPHFKLKNWSSNPLDWVNNMPSIDIDWYAKGAIFTKPTLFNTARGLKGFGEAGPEAAIPLTESVLGTIGKMIADTMDSKQTVLSGPINVTIDAKTVQEFTSVVDFFNYIQQTSRKMGKMRR